MSFTNLAEQWGAAIRARRAHQRISLERLAETAGIDAGHLSKIERGMAGIGDEARIRLAVALDVRVEDLFVYPETRSGECPSAASAWDAAASRQSETPTPKIRHRSRSRRPAPPARAAAPSATEAAPPGTEAAS